MSLTNVSVYSTTSKTTLLQWHIMSIDPPDVTFVDYFRDKPMKLLPLLIKPCELHKILLGSGKDSLDEADVSLCVFQVILTFDAFINFIVVEDSSTTPQAALHSGQNAFQIMLASQQLIGNSHVRPLQTRLSPSSQFLFSMRAGGQCLVLCITHELR